MGSTEGQQEATRGNTGRQTISRHGGRTRRNISRPSALHPWPPLLHLQSEAPSPPASDACISTRRQRTLVASGPRRPSLTARGGSPIFSQFSTTDETTVLGRAHFHLVAY